MASADLDLLATNTAKIAAGGITGVMALTSGQSTAELTTLFGKYTGTTSTAVATGMASADLDLLATNTAKIAAGGITGVMALTSGQSTAELTTLFGKYTGTTSTAVATSMASADLDLLATNTAKIAAGGITGVMALTSGQSNAELTTLFGKYTGSTNTVVATSRDSTDLDLLAANAGKIAAGGITGVMALTSDQSDTELTALFGKSEAVANDTVVATSMNSAALDVVAANTAKIGTDGISGTFTATIAQAATVGLGVKVDASALVSITGFTTNGAESIETGVFQSGSDRLVLSDAVFTLAGTDGDTTLGSDFSSTTTAAMAGGAVGTATDAELIVFDATTGVLYYNSDGAVAGGFTAITTIGVNTLAATDFDIVA
jgi:hypothetical protein